jgi:hypothetical protein
VNAYIANTVARDHVDDLLASASAYRRVKEARQGRRSRRARPGHVSVAGQLAARIHG